jgi:hypothetical protein
MLPSSSAFEDETGLRLFAVLRRAWGYATSNGKVAISGMYQQLWRDLKGEISANLPVRR